MPADRRNCRCSGAGQHLRRGTTVVEMAFIGPVVFLLLIGLIVMVLGTFRFNQVTALAHEGARWASVRGATFDSLNDRSTPVDAEDLFREVIQPRAAGLDRKRLTYKLIWGPDRRTVSVSVEYRWGAEAFFGERLMSGTSTSLVFN